MAQKQGNFEENRRIIRVKKDSVTEQKQSDYNSDNK